MIDLTSILEEKPKDGTKRKRSESSESDDDESARAKKISFSNNNYTRAEKTMADQMQLFLRNEVDQHLITAGTLTNCYTIIDNLTNETYKVNKNHDITLDVLKTYFDKTGHAFGYPIAENYIVPLILDFDCPSKNKPGAVCEQHRSKAFIATILDQVQKLIVELQDETPAIKKANVTTLRFYPFVKTKYCGVHIYANVCVSIIYLHELIRRISECLPNDCLVLDEPDILPLPWSAKCSEDIYHPYQKDGEILLPSFSSKFIDLPLDLTAGAARLDMAAQLLGEVTCRNKNFFSNPLLGQSTHFNRELESSNLTYYPQMAFYSSTIPNVIAKLRSGNFNFECGMDAYESFFSPKRQAVDDITFEMQEFVTTLTALKLDEELDTYRTITSNMILSIYAKKIIEPEETFTFLLQQLLGNEEQFYLYFIALVSFYFEAFSTVTAHETPRSIIVDIVAFICALLRSISKPLPSTISVCLERLPKDYSVLDRLISPANNNASYWLFKLNLDRERKKYESFTEFMENNTPPCKIVDAEELTRQLIRYLVCSNSIIRNARGQYYHFNQQCNFYELLDMTKHKVDLKNTLKAYTNSLKIPISILPNCIQTNLIVTAINTYFSTLLTITDPLSFNDYAFYINSKNGIFNTITGLYLDFTPLLHFSTIRQHAPTIRHSSAVRLSICQQNSNLLVDLEAATLLYNFVAQRQSSFYYHCIVNVGVIQAASTFILPELVLPLGENLFNVLLFDINRNQAEILDAFLPIFYKYPLCLDKLVTVVDTVTALKQAKRPIANALQTSESSSSANSALSNFTMDALPLVMPEDTIIYNNPHVFYDHIRSKHAIFTDNFINFITAYVLQIFINASRGEKTPINYPPEHQLEKHEAYWQNRTSFEMFSHILDVNNFPNYTDFNQTLFAFSLYSNFNTEFFNDLLQTLALTYSPRNTRKRIILFISKSGCAKSTIVKLMNIIHTPSATAINTQLCSGGSNKSGSGNPMLYSTLQSYFIGVNEVNYAEGPFIKSMTGDDTTTTRQLYSNAPVQFKPISLIIAAANAYPKIPDADEAIAARLAIFPFTLQFKNNLHQVLNNTFLRYTENIITAKSMNEEMMAKHLATILYIAWKRVISDTFVHENKISNLHSHVAKDNLMARNNLIYRILRQSGIVIHESLSITLGILQGSVANTLMDLKEGKRGSGDSSTLYGEGRDNNFSLSWFKRSVGMLFTEKRTETGEVGYLGLGLQSQAQTMFAHDPAPLLEACEGSNVTVTQLVTALLQKGQHSQESIEIFITRYKNQFLNYNDVFLNVKLTEREVDLLADLY